MQICERTIKELYELNKPFKYMGKDAFCVCVVGRPLLPRLGPAVSHNLVARVDSDVRHQAADGGSDSHGHVVLLGHWERWSGECGVAEAQERA